MLPYFPPPPPLHLFGLRLPIFGLFLLGAALTAYLLVTLRGRKQGLGARLPEQIAGVLLLGAIVGAHLTGTLAEHGAAVFTAPALLLRLDASLSSAGGFAGAAVAGALAIRVLRVDRRTALAMADLAAFAFPFAWLLARSGCALVHDHPGRLSSSPLALPFPDGPRLDCGLLELLATPLLVALAIHVSRGSRVRRGPSDTPGSLAASMAVAYSLLRFPLDFLRSTDLPTSDPRHSGLTAAQWITLPLFLSGALSLVALARESTHRPPPR